MIAHARSLAFAAVAAVLAAPVFAQDEDDALWRAIQATPEAQAAAKADPGVWNAELDAQALQACLDARSPDADPSACRATITDRCEGDGETFAMLACAERESEAWSVVETAARLQLLEGSSPAQSEALKAAHEAWLAFRQADCASQALEFEGGSMARVLGAGCHATHTVERALDLRSRLSDRGL